MICTEQEARKKWCPMVRHPGWMENPGSWNRGEAFNCNCIASDCMMWRWTGECKTGVPITSISKHGPTELGYCGLGGKP
jgi:hypothetical protein